MKVFRFLFKLPGKILGSIVCGIGFAVCGFFTGIYYGFAEKE